MSRLARHSTADRPSRSWLWVSIVLAVPALAFLPLFGLSLLPGASLHPNLRLIYWLGMLWALPCGPVSVVVWTVALARGRATWFTTLLVGIAVAGSYAAFGRSRLMF